MKQLSTISRLLAAAGMIVGMAGHASAAPTFTINPSAIPGTANGVFTADALSVLASSELVTLSAPAGSAAGTGAGTGWAQFGGYTLNGQPIFGFQSGLGNTYQMYLTFSLGVQLNTGLLGLPGSTYSITQLDFQVWADPNLQNAARTQFFQATNAGAGGTQATISNNADDFVLAVGSLLPSPVNSASITSGFGVGLNALNSFAVCTGNGTADIGGTAIPVAACLDGRGDQYFDTPTPFHQLVFSALNNTTQGVTISGNGQGLAINAAGRVDFAAVPEPASLALVGFALVGLGASTMRKRKAA